MEQEKRHTNYTAENIGFTNDDPLYEFSETYLVERLHKSAYSDVAIGEIFYYSDKNEVLSTKEIKTESKGMIEGKKLLFVIFKDSTGETHEAYAHANTNSCEFSLHTFTAVGKQCPLNLIGYRLKYSRNF